MRSTVFVVFCAVLCSLVLLGSTRANALAVAEGGGADGNALINKDAVAGGQQQAPQQQQQQQHEGGSGGTRNGNATVTAEAELISKAVPSILVPAPTPAPTSHPRRQDPPWAVFITCILSHISCIAPIVAFWRRRWLFELCIAVGGFISSFMYHTCQAFNTTIILNELKWHIMDNIFVICCFVNLWVYLSLMRDARLDFLTKAGGLFVSIVLQLRSPWSVSHTFAPILFFTLFPIVSLCYNRHGWAPYDLKAMAMGSGILAVAVPFFILGLDDANDPYRMFHGLWHLFVGTAAYYLWRSVRNPMATQLQSIVYADNSYGYLTRANLKVADAVLMKSEA